MGRKLRGCWGGEEGQRGRGGGGGGRAGEREEGVRERGREGGREGVVYEGEGFVGGWRVGRRSGVRVGGGREGVGLEGKGVGWGGGVGSRWKEGGGRSRARRGESPVGKGTSIGGHTSLSLLLLSPLHLKVESPSSSCLLFRLLGCGCTTEYKYHE